MGMGLHDSQVSNPVLRWIDQRLPVITMIQKEYGVFPTPRNFNYFWNFGALAMINLMIMIATGIFLAMNYTPHTAYAFDSVERIMRDVNGGDIIQPHHIDILLLVWRIVRLPNTGQSRVHIVGRRFENSSAGEM